MKSKNPALTWDRFMYTLVMLIANFAGYLAVMAVLVLLRSSSINPYLRITAIVLSVFAVTSVVTAIITAIYFSRIMERYYEESAQLPQAIKSGLALILPGEILRYAASVIWIKPSWLCLRFFDGIVTFIPSMTQYMLFLGGREEEIRMYGYTAGDHISYILIYLVYFIINAAILCFVFWRMWKRQEKIRNAEKSDPTRLTMDPEQMK